LRLRGSRECASMFAKGAPNRGATRR